MSTQEDFQKDIDNIGQIPIVSNILDVICRTTGMGFAAIARVTDDRWITCSSLDYLDFGLKPGDELEVKTTICDEIRENNMPVIIENVSEDPIYFNHHTPAMYGIQSYISVPIIKKDGTFFGTLCAIDPKPRNLQMVGTKEMFLLFSDLISFHLHALEEINLNASKFEGERKRYQKNEESQKLFTERLEMEVGARTKELNESKAHLQSVMNSSHYGIASYEPIKDDKGNIVDFTTIFTNAEVPKNFGLEPFQVIGKTCREVYPGIFENGVFEMMAACFETGKPQTYEVSVSIDGVTTWLSAAVEKVNGSITITSKNTTDEKNAAIRLEEMLSQMERSNKELESFNYIASHDLQEPLRKIQLFYSRIMDKDEKNLSEESREYFSSIHSAAERMQNLITALLSYSTASYTDLNFEKTDLNKLLAEVKSDLEDRIVAKNAVIESDLLPKMAVIPFQFRQLLSNLISNGIKYSKKDTPPEIKITTETEDRNGKKFVKFMISDNGIGFEQQYEHKIFELFQRLHGKTEFVGTGIGLAICKKIVANHKGFIEVTSEPNVGSVFTVRIPMKS